MARLCACKSLLITMSEPSLLEVSQLKSRMYMFTKHDISVLVIFFLRVYSATLCKEFDEHQE